MITLVLFDLERTNTWGVAYFQGSAMPLSTVALTQHPQNFWDPTYAHTI